MEKKENQDSSKNFIEDIAAFIVDKRKGFFLIFIGAVIYCILSISKVTINNDITSYLPADSETRQGLTLMDSEFTTLGTAKIMVCNITYDRAKALSEEIEQINGVSSITFDDSEDYYKGASALFAVTFTGEEEDAVSKEAMENIKALLTDYDTYISSEVGENAADALAGEMQTVLAIAVIIILAVLLFTSRTYMEIPVLLITFIVAAILNLGTNYWFGQISFITNSIEVVLQLALAIDYSIVLCHRYTEEREKKEPREALITAWSKAVIEIGSSSLTAIAGLAALMFMQFRLGYDMGSVLIKAIIFSLISVLLLMPGLLMLFHKGIDKTHHKNFVPKITIVGRFSYLTRFIIPPLFFVIIMGAFFQVHQNDYVFGSSKIKTVKQNASQIAEEKIKDTFGTDNTLAIVVPKGDYDAESKLLSDLSVLPHVESATGLGNVEIEDYVLTQELNPRQFAELTNLDIEVARLLYTAYAISNNQFGYLVNGVNSYSIPILDMFLFAYEKEQEGYVTLDSETEDTLDKIHKNLDTATKQLQGENYSRMILSLDLPEEGEETFSYLTTVRNTVSKYYSNFYLVGNSVNDYDLSKSFATDDIIITVLTIVFVVAILLFTFQSSGLPLLLVLVIQGSIWINFALQALSGNPLHFISYLIVCAIQMGATINYAIFITNRYMKAKKYMSIKEAMIEALNGAFSTIITSGTILSTAGLAIGRFSSDPVISTIGSCLGRGTILSIFLVLGVLPQILLLCDLLIEKTAFTLREEKRKKLSNGNVFLDGHIKGYVSGIINANIKGTIKGSIDASFERKSRNRDYSIEECSMEEIADIKKEDRVEEIVEIVKEYDVKGLKEDALSVKEVE